MVEEKKKSGNVVVIIILMLIIIGLIFYICYDKGLLLKQGNKKNREETKEEVEKEKEEGVELDIHSVLVQELYNKVSDTTDKISWKRYRYYRYYNYGIDDFVSQSASEILKMQLVEKNFRMSDEVSVDCTKVPDEFVEEGFTYESFCKRNKINGFETRGYKKDVVERIYQELFGMNQKIDTSVSIITSHELSKFVYVPSLDMYVEYVITVGDSITGPGGYKGTLSKAIKNDKQMKLYEKVEKYEPDTYPNLIVTDTFTFVYTFEQESAGNYKFVSRIKEESK